MTTESQEHQLACGYNISVVNPSENYTVIRVNEQPFNTLEKFFDYYTSLLDVIPLESIKQGGLTFFKDKIEPKTEDRQNCIRYRLPDDYEVNDDTYLRLFLLPLGVQLPQINGIYTCHLQDKWRLEIWGNGDIPADGISKISEFLNIQAERIHRKPIKQK